MMKKIIILSILGVFITVSAIMAIAYFNKKTVTFTFDNTDYSVVIQDTENRHIQTLKQPGEVRLPKGEYTYQVDGADLDTEGVSFTVGQEAVIVPVTSKLAPSGIAKLSLTEDERIKNSITTIYEHKSAFTIESINYYERGAWASAQLIVAIPQQVPDVYNVVLKKEGDAWVVKVPPTIAIYKGAYKDVPETILYQLYSY